MFAILFGYNRTSLQIYIFMILNQCLCVDSTANSIGLIKYYINCLKFAIISNLGKEKKQSARRLA